MILWPEKQRDNFDCCPLQIALFEACVTSRLSLSPSSHVSRTLCTGNRNSMISDIFRVGTLMPVCKHSRMTSLPCPVSWSWLSSLCLLKPVNHVFNATTEQLQFVRDLLILLSLLALLPSLAPVLKCFFSLADLCG